MIDPPESLQQLVSGRAVDHSDYDKTSLSGWAGAKAKTKKYLEDCAREISIVDTLNELSEKLKATSIKPLVLGGVALWAKEYPSVGQRRVYDVDLWVSEEDYLDFVRLLNDCGFTQNQTFQMLFHRGAVEIDLHKHPINNERGGAFDHLFYFDTQQTWQKSQPLPCCPDGPFRRPCDEDLWVHLALHAIKHEYERLNLLVDLHLLLENHLPQSELGRRLWIEVTPALQRLGLDSKLPSEKPSSLAYGLCLERPNRPFLAGLRVMASLGRSPLKFWLSLALGNAGVRRESSTVMRWKRILKRLYFKNKKPLSV